MLQKSHNFNSFVKYDENVTNCYKSVTTIRAGPRARIRAHLYYIYARAGKLEAGSWKGAGTMLIIGAGIALGGMVVGSFASLGVVAACEVAGWALMGAAELMAERKERQAAQKLAAYPSYKYIIKKGDNQYEN